MKSKEKNEGVYNDEYNMGVFMGISANGQIGGGDLMCRHSWL
jgi:hypothetical protein